MDAPGHIEFLNNMASEVSRADAALLVNDAQEEIKENFKMYMYLFSRLVIKNVTVLVNKMDLVCYDETIFNIIVKEYKESLPKLDIDSNLFIPVLELYGENIFGSTTKIPRYKAKYLLETLDSLQSTLTDKLFRNEGRSTYIYTKG